MVVWAVGGSAMWRYRTLLILMLVLLISIPATIHYITIIPYGSTFFSHIYQGFDGKEFEFPFHASAYSVGYGIEINSPDGIGRAWFVLNGGDVRSDDISQFHKLVEAQYLDQGNIESSFFAPGGFAFGGSATLSLTETTYYNLGFSIYDESIQIYCWDTENQTGDERDNLIEYQKYHVGLGVLGSLLVTTSPPFFSLELGVKPFWDPFNHNHSIPLFCELNLFDTGGFFAGVNLYSEYDLLSNWTTFKITAGVNIRIEIPDEPPDELDSY